MPFSGTLENLLIRNFFFLIGNRDYPGFAFATLYCFMERILQITKFKRMGGGGEGGKGGGGERKNLMTRKK